MPPEYLSNRKLTVISVLILTLDEEANIADCIASIPWRNDVYVLDSGSTDRTCGIAAALGAKVTTRSFDGYARQRNAGLALPFEHEWVVMLDADERMTPDLVEEIEHAVATASSNTALMMVRRKDMFMGRWLRRSSGYPTWFPRVFRKGRVRVSREINEVYEADGQSVRLRNHIVHHPFKKGIDWWFERHNRYSAAEAQLLGKEIDYKALPDAVSRRRARLKALAYKLPLRPFIAFIYLYFIRLGFLDGRAGYHFATMRMAYEVMIDAKNALTKSIHRDIPPPNEDE